MIRALACYPRGWAMRALPEILAAIAMVAIWLFTFSAIGRLP